jgi:biopolymer transport protein ExbD
MAAKKRVGVAIDMTPMVDIGFLLVIFFMSTYHARPPETVKIDLPYSRSQLKVPEKDVIIISVLTPEGAAAMVDSFNPTLVRQNYRRYLLARALGDTVRASPEDKSKALFEASLSDKALAIDQTIQEVREDPVIRSRVLAEGKRLTPMQKAARRDSMLYWWNTGRDAAQPFLLAELPSVVQAIRLQNENLYLVVKTDSLSESGTVLNLMDLLRKPQVGMNPFSLVTMMKESHPVPPAKKKEGA